MDIDLLRSSFALAVGREPDLVARFYELLFERHPRARALFGRNTQVAQQKMLTEALVAVLAHLEDQAWFRSTLLALGAKHVGYGVTEEMYGWVGECLLATLREVTAAAWTPAHEAAWTAAYGAIAATMLEGARQAEPAPARDAAAVAAG